ncbi:fungal-specific transcription factor domain-containing protein [Camillea tinctor]|nr:fungal-specific transcription factor domain-containing protein [Camillea tinctor]
MKAAGRGRKTRVAAPNGRLACVVCKDSKTRCDRAEPSCSRCVRLHLQCSYESRTTWSTDRVNMARQLVELRGRLAQAEARLDTSIVPAYSVDPNNAMQVPEHIGLPHSQAVLSSGGASLQKDRGTEFIDGNPLHGCSLSQSHALPSPNINNLMNTIPGFDLDIASCLSRPPYNANFSNAKYKTNELADEELDMLHDAYFSTWDAALPILSRYRFMKESTYSTYSPDLCLLRYAVALMGTMNAPRFSHLEHKCYMATREYLETCETSEDDSDLASLNTLQALILIVRHELTQRRFRRAWMTLGRTVRLAKLLNLHKMDDSTSTDDVTSPGPHISLPSTEDRIVLEERRRTFWALYIFESYASTHTGMPCQLGDIDLQINLPCPGRLDLEFHPIPMPTLATITSIHNSTWISSYSATVLMVEVAYRCFDHARSLGTTTQTAGFWDKNYSLVKHFDWLKDLLRVHFEDKVIKEDSLCFSFLMNLSAVEIVLYESAAKKVEREGLPHALAAESNKQATTSALKIMRAVEVVRPTFGSNVSSLHSNNTKYFIELARSYPY